MVNMAFYVNKDGILVEALQWDGSSESRKEIQEKLGFSNYWNHSDSGSYYFKSPITGKLDAMEEDEFLEAFSEITDERINLASLVYREVLKSLADKQAKGKDDDWRDRQFWELNGWLGDEVFELYNEIALSNIEGIKEEAPHVIICAAMILDKALREKEK